MTGQVYANSEATALNFNITPSSITVGEYFPPVDLAIERSPFGGLTLTLTFTAESNGWYALYGSENLTDWIPLGFHPGLLNGKRSIIPPTNLPKRFFKVERVPPVLNPGFLMTARDAKMGKVPLRTMLNPN